MKRRKPLTLSGRTNITGWLFVAPFVLGFLMFFLFPLINTVIYTFNKVNLEVGYYDLKWVGWDNYRYIFREDTTYIWNFINSLTQLCYQVPVVIVSSLFFAVLLNRKFIGRTFARAVFFLPVIIASGVVIQILKNDVVSNTIMAGNTQALTAQTTAFNSAGLQELLINSGLSPSIISFFVTISNQIFSMLWKTGIQMLIFLTALQSIPPSLYEASSVEGASSWENFWMITLPMISPMMIINIVYTIIDSFTNIENSVISQIYDKTMGLQFELSAAMSIPYLLAVIIVLGVVLLLYRKISGGNKKGGYNA